MDEDNEMKYSVHQGAGQAGVTFWDAGMFKRMHRWIGLGALLCAGWAYAAFPAKPITLVVPFPAGGPADVMGRSLARAMSERLGQQVIVENRPGAGGALGIAAVARSPADGYTMSMAGTGAMVYAPFIVQKMPFDPLKGVTHLGTMVRTPNVLVVKMNSGIETLSDLVVRARAEPGKLRIAVAGMGSSTHVVGALLQSEAGIRLNVVPYKGAAPAVQDLIGGHVDMFIAEVPAVAHFIKAGTLRGLLVTDTKRLSLLPEVPTAAQSGVPKLLADGTYGVIAPPGLPADVAAKLANAVADAVSSSDVSGKFAKHGGIAQPGTPGAYRALLESEQRRWAPVIKAAGITAE
ncbi:Bug family tripartite tricarboxylate transporter substrate binding protein [Azohydromonas australica]|uniref:Bug family tripartite tricarboxylate transporter substrate binding protein n=1 Tax=Azohydromonas australica TaxID=364039 RepID=UPI0009FBD66B|nr:tripartite tricarboxylate transporter substrate binding protein [Azohydromonas australica]